MADLLQGIDIIQLVLIASITFIVFAIIIFAAMNMGGSKNKKNIDLIRGKSGSDSAENDADLQHKRRAEIAKKLKSSKDEDAEDGEQSKVSISMKLQQAGIESGAAKFWILSAISCVVCIGLGKMMGVGNLALVFFAIVGLLGIPRFILKKLIQRRQKKFLEEFADALDAVVRLLKAGMPVAEAVSMISREFDGPVGEEMSIIYDKQKIGIPLHEAAQEGCRRMPLAEMQMFAAGLAIQAQTGSSLSEVLINLSNVIRARFRLKRKIMALSSEAIASASIIGALPIVVATGLYAVNPEYLEPLFTTETGKHLLMGAGCWMGMGVFVMKQMINFKI